jgi:hypothetical protein
MMVWHALLEPLLLMNQSVGEDVYWCCCRSTLVLPVVDLKLERSRHGRVLSREARRENT